MSAVAEKNSKNQDYFNLTVASGGYVSKDLYERGEKLYEAIAAGNVKVDQKFDEQTSGEGDSRNEY